jgi:hypothetical protein
MFLIVDDDKGTSIGRQEGWCSCCSLLLMHNGRWDVFCLCLRMIEDIIVVHSLACMINHGPNTRDAVVCERADTVPALRGGHLG